MTREELIEALHSWRPPERWTSETCRERDLLQFALWWYGGSSEAAKPRPDWPDDDYVEVHLGSGLSYLTSLDAALSLVPNGLNWLIGRNYLGVTGAPYGAQLTQPGSGWTDEVVAEAEVDSAPLAVCIAAMQARAA